MTFKIDPTDIESNSNRRHRSSAPVWNRTLLFGGFSMSAIPNGSTAQEVFSGIKVVPQLQSRFCSARARRPRLRGNDSNWVPWITFLVDSASNFLGNSAEYQLRQGV